MHRKCSVVVSLALARSASDRPCQNISQTHSRFFFITQQQGFRTFDVKLQVSLCFSNAAFSSSSLAQLPFEDSNVGKLLAGIAALGGAGAGLAIGSILPVPKDTITTDDDFYERLTRLKWVASLMLRWKMSTPPEPFQLNPTDTKVENEPLQAHLERALLHGLCAPQVLYAPRDSGISYAVVQVVTRLLKEKRIAGFAFEKEKIFCRYVHLSFTYIFMMQGHS